MLSLSTSPFSLLPPSTLSSPSPALTLHRPLPLIRLKNPKTPSLLAFCSPPSQAGISPISTSSSPLGDPFSDFVEKDWSFLEFDHVNTNEEIEEKSKRIIEAAAIRDDSKVLVCLGTEDFVDRVRASSQCQLLVVHYSLYVLAGVKEKYDTVRCWQGDIVDVPAKWAPFDAIFLCFFPALPCSLDRLFGALVERCSPGACVVISYAQGREIVERQRQRYPEMVTSDLPDKDTLEKLAAANSFQITDFIDEPNFYLATLKFV
ncbi:uncharacterized protein LOC18439356 [Amborella trichopoda]|uniref:Methyltransferase type 11 domain-containing protein n=1 Tax=Amborella trichopoda TaxID=13333 RepID=W1PU18_AMBTC|nr:uncharacterized protein LOC18439356 [Amborella trichopoda]ERN11166.1 hypothetical protein AMTR_s00024p00194890 [Amborella trichopoda]|eukprot:XP_006849585.1 uncharacterized protein LOC18439356 [Amborella trichopoda]